MSYEMQYAMGNGILQLNNNEYLPLIQGKGHSLLRVLFFRVIPSTILFGTRMTRMLATRINTAF